MSPNSSNLPGKLNLDRDRIDRCHRAAEAIAQEVLVFARARSTVSIERAILRLLGVSGADHSGVPHVNNIVLRFQGEVDMRDGIAIHLGAMMIEHRSSLNDILDGLVRRKHAFKPLPSHHVAQARHLIAAAANDCWQAIADFRTARRAMRQRLGEKQGPAAYVLTATGNVYEDVRHAEAVAEHGGDIVAVIRSTAQSLLDFVPFGPTTEGYGGTYATQENFRIMRSALDAWSERNGRYVRLSSFASGLCMPEIAAMGAIEGLDNMVNDALYGILYRDINMERTLIDQMFSRAINGAAGTVINTGEDNYLRTADAVEAAPSIVVSQMINFHIARKCGLTDDLIAVGGAFEVEPSVENSLLIEWAHALLTRELFPSSPVKYMPPTRFMDGNLLRTHACDTLFNLITVATRQGIQTIGVPTEGVFTPHIHDRALALGAVNYVKTAAKDLFDDIDFVENGRIKTRARTTLLEAESLIEQIRGNENGLMGAIEQGIFGDVRRMRDSGRGRDGVFERGPHYTNPFETLWRSHAW